jgi:hypothetical protein
MKKTSSRTKTSKKRTSSLLDRVIPNKWVAAVFIAIIAGLGSYFVFFSQAAPSNCQNQSDVPVCDVDQTLLSSNSIYDTILSTNSEAKDYADKGRGVYYGPAFRAPTKALNGAVQIYRVYNEKATYHDWVTETQKAAKEAKYEGVKVQSTPFFAWKTKVTGTVPVYRLTRDGKGGALTQSVFSTDKSWVDKMLAAGANDSNGWKKDQFGPFIAFYAFPPGYAVPGVANPGDCSKAENLNNPECKTQRDALENSIGTGAIPSSNTCPTTLDAYLKAVFPSQFSQSCQDKWNAYMRDCSKQENFLSDRCSASRDKLEAAYDCSVQENFLSDRCAKERDQLAAAYNCSVQENFLSDRCLAERSALANAARANAARAQAARGQTARAPSVPRVPNGCPRTVQGFASANKQGLSKDCINIWTKYLNDLKFFRELERQARVNAGNNLYEQYYGGVNRNEANNARAKGTCVIRYKYYVLGGWPKAFPRVGVEVKKNTTKEQCEMEFRYLIQKKKEQDNRFFGADMHHHAFEKAWVRNRT